MRAGEIYSLEWQHVNERHVHLPLTKNGYPRGVPLSAEARGIIEQLQSLNDEEGAVFGVSTASLDALFRKAKPARSFRMLSCIPAITEPYQPYQCRAE